MSDGSLYVADDSVIRKIDLGTAAVTTVAVICGPAFSFAGTLSSVAGTGLKLTNAIIGETFTIAFQHFKIREAPMCPHHRLCTLEMGVTWQNSLAMAVG